MELTDDRLRAAGETIDRIAASDLRYGEMDAFPTLMHDLYAAAREEAGEPLTYAAATAIRDAVSFLDTVLIVTGAGMDPWVPQGETDGPPGAIAIAHAVAVALDARPVIAVEERSMDPVIAGARGCGLLEVPFEILEHRHRAVSVVPYPAGPEQGDAAAADLLATYDPAAVVTVERMGPNRDGEMVVHAGGFDGFDYVGENAWVPPLIERAREDGIPTVGIGDRGNEAGFGRIEEAVQEIYAPEGMADVACSVTTDHLVSSGTSNWGAYGVAAMLSLLTETPEALHDPNDESRMLDHLTAAGCVDAVTNFTKPTVDGTSEDVQRAIVTLLNEVVGNQLSESGFSHSRREVRAAERPED